MGLAYTLKTKLRVKRQMRACISVAFQKGIGGGGLISPEKNIRMY